MISIEDIKSEIDRHISFRKKRLNVYQISAPFYHEDGDMIDMYIDLSSQEEGKLTISDFGMTLMRLSYTYELDSPNKEKIFNKIINTNGIDSKNGILFLQTESENLYPAIMQFAQAIFKVSNMKLYQREIVRSLFFEMLEEHIENELLLFHPAKNYHPILDNEEYEVDYCFNNRPKPIFLFGVNSASKARLATISCLKFQTENIKFRSVMVLENIDVLTRKDLSRLMSVADKEFPSLEDFTKNSRKYLERELDIVS